MEEIERFTKKIKSDIDQCYEGKVILLSFLEKHKKQLLINVYSVITTI